MPRCGRACSGSAGSSGWPAELSSAARRSCSAATARRRCCCAAATSASAATLLAGAAPDAIAAGVRSFAGVEHRLEFVAEIGGVSFYNDSKATNVDATLKAVDAFAGNLLVILGGKDKGGDFSLLREPLRRRARLALLVGAAAEKIAVQLAGAVPVERPGELDRAVRLAFEHARSGDVVLLAPACASFDQFENFEHRGRVFKQLVRQLEQQHAGEPARLS